MVTKIICITNFKGGVGKTTSTLNIGYALAHLGYKVCMIDLDPQASLSISLGLRGQKLSIYELLFKNINFKEVRKKLTDNISIIPSHYRLMQSELELSSVFQKEYVLKKAISSHKKEFDFIIIDTPPSLGNLTFNGLVISDYIFTPVETEFLSLDGFSTLQDALQKIGMKINAIFFTKFDKRKTINREVVEYLNKNFKGEIFKTPIRDNIKLAESQSQFKDIFSYDNKSYGSLDYLQLTNDILNYIKR